MADYITKKTKPAYITKKVKPEYIKKKEPKTEWITKKAPKTEWITKKKPTGVPHFNKGGRATHGYGKAYLKGGRVK